jgi:hypothetical protein
MAGSQLLIENKCPSQPILQFDAASVNGASCPAFSIELPNNLLMEAAAQMKNRKTACGLNDTLLYYYCGPRGTGVG